MVMEVFQKLIVTTNPITEGPSTIIVETNKTGSDFAITTLEGEYKTVEEFEAALDDSIQTTMSGKVGAMFNFFPMKMPDAYALYGVLAEALEQKLVENPLPAYRLDSTNIQALREMLKTLREMRILLGKVEDRLTVLEGGVLLFIMSYEREPSSLKHPYRIWCPQCDKYVTGMSPETHPRKLSCPECGHKGMTILSPEDRKSLRHAVETLARRIKDVITSLI